MRVIHLGREFRRQPTQGGFVLTLELILIITILGIGLLVGLFAIRDALFKRMVNQQSQAIIVSDANGVILGRAIGVDEHEAPLIPYIDRTQPDANYRVLIGVRDDRFTSREPVYFTQLNCQGPPCIKRTSSERGDNQGTDSIPGTGAVSYFNALQGDPNYAVGPSAPEVIGSNPLPGWLYRQTAVACEYDNIQAATGSRYISQKVVFGEPCESPFVLPLPIASQPVVQCSGDPGDPGAIPPEPADVTCPQVAAGSVPACGTVQSATGELACACPLSYFDVGDTGTDLLTVHTCCPEGTVGDIEVDGLPTVCVGDLLFEAESVPSPEDNTLNALQPFEPPFQVNLPPDVDDFISVAPDGCEGFANPDGSCPTQTDYPVFTPPDGEG